MNEDKLIRFLNNLDDDLAEREIDKLLDGEKVNVDSIKSKAHIKLNRNKKKVKCLKKQWAYAAAVAVCLISVTTVYADEISEAIKSFLNITPIYSTAIKGEGYYLKEKHVLNEDMTIESVMVSQGNLEMNMVSSLNLSNDDICNICIIPKDELDTVYFPGGYSKEQDQYFFSFMNKTENNYNIKPFKEFKLIIGENTYEVSLEEAKSMNMSTKIYTANIKNSTQGVHIGAEVIDRNEKLNIRLLTSFDDDLQLKRLGKPIEEKVILVTENKGNKGIFSSSTGSKTEPLYILDEEGNKYGLRMSEKAIGRPVTLFETDAPHNKSLTLHLPAILAYYPKKMDDIYLTIPKEGDVWLNREINFNIQKAVIKSISRVSPTSAKIECQLNTEGNKNVDIRSFDLYSPDVKKISAEFDGNKGIVMLEFDESLESTNIQISYPVFIMNGNWEISIN